MNRVFVERLWRSVEYEFLYLHGFATVLALKQCLGDYSFFTCTSGRTSAWNTPRRRKYTAGVPIDYKQFAARKLLAAPDFPCFTHTACQLSPTAAAA
jgi:hypothetical protein